VFRYANLFQRTRDDRFLRDGADGLPIRPLSVRSICSVCIAGVSALAYEAGQVGVPGIPVPVFVSGLVVLISSLMQSGPGFGDTVKYRGYIVYTVQHRCVETSLCERGRPPSRPRNSPSVPETSHRYSGFVRATQPVYVIQERSWSAGPLFAARARDDGCRGYDLHMTIVEHALRPSSHCRMDRASRVLCGIPASSFHRSRVLRWPSLLTR